MLHKVLRLSAILAILISSAFSQENRSMISGRVLDAQNAVIAGATVVVRNVDTGVTLTFKTNETGYYQASLLLPGNYEISAEASGFKKLERKGIILSVSSSPVVDLQLQVGGTTETISVTAETPLLETGAVNSGRILDNKSVMELPVMGNSVITLVKLTPGIFTGGVNNYLALHSNQGGSDYSTEGNVGGNDWTLDGAPNNGPSRRVAYLPYTDAVSEFKVETSNFSADVGASTGASITMISKSGQNDLHGTATWQHWQQRWQGTPFFTKQNYYRSITAAEAAGNSTLANQLRNTDKQPAGRSNNWGASGGGPVYIPKLYDGRNKVFWFFTYNAFKDTKTEDPSTFNKTVPTANARNGDFSEMLSLSSPAQYIVYDPVTVTRDPARPTNYIRAPFAGNIIPKSRFVNPAYNAITKLYPMPNNPPLPGAQPVNNYLASKTPYNWDYRAFSNRIDAQISNKVRMFGRWSANNFFPEDRGDWTYETARGLNQNGLVRNNKGGNIDLVWTQGSATVWDFNIAMNQFREGGQGPLAITFKPTDIGLPAYLDQKAGDQHILPRMDVNGYTVISPSGVAAWTRYRIGTGKAEMSHVRGKHTLRAAFDVRERFRTGGGGGNTSGNFTFANNYTRKDDAGTAANNLPLGWAAFILGIPNSMTISDNDTYAMLTPYYATFVQDSWRVSSRLTLTLGLRMETEPGTTERYNRMLNGFDPSATLPITAAAQAAYAANPLTGANSIPASQFIVRGGSLYAGVGSTPRQTTHTETMWLPRVGAAYQLNTSTVVRIGYGIYYDTLNSLNFGPDQTGFSRTTSTTVTTNQGETWGSSVLPFSAAANPANFKSLLVDPFPVRSDGSRFDVPTGNALGLSARTGRGLSYSEFGRQKHARQQRWRVSLQHQFAKNWVVEGAYAGSYADRLSVSRRLDALPEQYWADGKVRNTALNSTMTTNVTNPFFINNFASLQQSNPLVYQDMLTQGFFTSNTIQRQRLLRPFPQMNANALNLSNDPVGWVNIHEIQVTAEKRFSQGFNFSMGYTATKGREKNFYLNEFDPAPTERINGAVRPHRLTMTGVYEFPFGRGKRLLNTTGPLNWIAGGWQLSGTYEFQQGGLVGWGNVFYYGNDVNAIGQIDTRTWDKWFNTDNFEKDPNKTAVGNHRRVFPTQLPNIRSDKTSQLNGTMAKNFRFGHESRYNLQLRLDALNIQNRSQMGGPNADPTSSNFGRITAQSAAINRMIDVQARITF